MISICMIRICLDSACHQIDECISCQKNALTICFLINFIMFAVELFWGWQENSATLLSDAAHNSGDALILGSSLFVILSSMALKAKLALFKSFIMGCFGLLAFYNVFLTIWTTTIPQYNVLTTIGTIALIGNILSVLLLMYYRNKDINLKSAYVCCRNDVIGSIGIIIAGVLVMYTNSYWPDVILGSVVGGIIIWSSITIAKESLNELKLNRK